MDESIIDSSATEAEGNHQDCSICVRGPSYAGHRPRKGQVKETVKTMCATPVPAEKKGE